jgi:2'-hydroxyisoflavone reductase
MRALIFGGTQFVGRHIAEEAERRGHSLTLVHRGKTNPGLFPGAEHVALDRLESLDALRGRAFDAVVDVSAYVPRAVRLARQALADQFGRYLFISTISVYDLAAMGAITHPDESAPLLELEDPTTEVINADTYGGLKVLCERGLADLGDRLTIVRPGIVVGRYDHTNRFHHWTREILTREEVAVPPRLDQPSQWIDGADLARLTWDLLEQGVAGAFNACGPATAETLGSMLNGIAAATDRNPTWIPADAEELPKMRFLLPQDGSADAMFRVSNAKAISAGLRFRPFAETVADVAAEIRAEPPQTSN